MPLPCTRTRASVLPSLLGCAVLVALFPWGVAGQEEIPGPGEERGAEVNTTLPSGGTESGIIAGLMGGIHGTSPGTHLFGGINTGYMASRWAGGEGVLLGGSGSGYGSLLAGAGPTLRFASGGWGEARLWIGGGWYREARTLPPGGESPANRASGVALAGLQARIPAGPVGLTAGVLGWTGRFEEAGFVEPAPFHGVRITLGVSR